MLKQYSILLFDADDTLFDFGQCERAALIDALADMGIDATEEMIQTYSRINDEMWSELFLLNKEALLRQMDTFLEQVWKMRGLLAAEDREGLREMMRTSTARRAKFDKK